VNLGIDPEFEEALDAARRSKRMTKTGYIRNTVVNDLIEKGFLSASKAKEANR
jgi:hypothetical protein